MIFDSLMGAFSLDMGIDLGTCNTLVYVKDRGIVLNEPSVVAVAKGTTRVLRNGDAVGLVAKEMIGHTPENIEAIRPLKNGVISDFEITEAMLSYFIRRVQGRKHFVGPRVVIAVPSGITGVEKRAVLDSAERAGARRVYLVGEPMAAAIGAGMPVTEPTASMIVDVGGGTTEIAIISLAGISQSRSVRVAGDDFDMAIVGHLKRNYNMAIGDSMAEKIKIQIGSAAPFAEGEPTMEVRGRDMISGLPRKTVITAGEVREALQDPVRQIIEAVTQTLEKAPAELSADLVDNGITMAGGSAQLRGLTLVLSNATGLTVKLADDPLTCVARGTGVYLENLELWKDTMESDADEH
ncbi:MAG: rod shape-determining protein [Tepidisphaeraceae bacterium]